MNFNGKTILITGGTGSFGSNFCKFLLDNHNPKRIVIFSRDELKQFNLKEKLSANYKLDRVRFFLGDVRDKDRLIMACKDVDIIIHAAALKQVPAAEYNPTECIKTNINGAENIVKSALENKVSRVIGLSTDKAVNPINLYGSTKLCSDKILVAGNNIKGKSATIFSVVRYGNVFNSRGSVYSVFKNQLKNKQPITLTDNKMTRFNISLEDSIKFVIKSINIMKGGEIFIPKIPSLKIEDLAKVMNGTKNKMKIIGLRPGEKLHEILCPKDESQNVIEYKEFFVNTPSITFYKKVNYFKYGSLKGKKVGRDFEYNSFTNNNYLNLRQIAKLVKNENSKANYKL